MKIKKMMVTNGMLRRNGNGCMNISFFRETQIKLEFRIFVL